MNLQTTVSTYTVPERALGLYKITTEIFEWSKTSDCVTPLEIVQKQFADCNVGGTLCIPGAGIGTYVVAALQAGFKPENITAVELDSAYYELGSAIYRRFGVNYVLSDFLTWEPEMQFDVVIGNPPYQAPKNANGAKMPPLWKLFIKRGGEFLKPGGFMSLLVPSQVAKFHEEGKPSPALQKVRDLAVVDVETGAERFFNVGSEICKISFVKGAQPDVITFNGNPWRWVDTPWVPAKRGEEEIELLLKLFSVKGRMPFFLQSHSKPLSVDPELTLGCWGMNRGKHYGFLPLDEITKRKVHLMCASFESKELRDKAIMLFNSPVYAFIKQMTMFGSDVSFKTLSALPVPENWYTISDPNDVADLFSLSASEKQLISKFI